MATVAEIAKIVAEPKWEVLLVDKGERALARAHWRRLTGEMVEAQTLAASNGHALQRLVLAYIEYDRASKMVAAVGTIIEPAKNNPRAIPRLSIHYQVMRNASADAEKLEAQLGLTPQRRGKVSKVKKTAQRSVGADAYRKPKDG